MVAPSTHLIKLILKRLTKYILMKFTAFTIQTPRYISKLVKLNIPQQKKIFLKVYVFFKILKELAFFLQNRLEISKKNLAFLKLG